MIRAVVFDLDGVLIDSEHLWDEVRRDVVAELGGVWRDDATDAMLGMSSPEWSSYLHDVLSVGLPPAQIAEVVVRRLLERYEASLPLLPGAAAAVERLGRRWPLALASSSTRIVIERVLELAGLGSWFRVTVSSQEVAHGKPRPDVHLEAARRLTEPAAACVAIEDSANGIRSARAAGMHVVALPNPRNPPTEEAVGSVDVVVDGLSEVTVELLETLERGPARASRLDEQEVESFPASDPHSDWAGPAR